MAVLTHSVTGPEDPADMGRNFTKQSLIIERARTLGLRHELEYEYWSTYLWVRSPRTTLEELARYADEELNRTVDVEEDDEDEEGFRPAAGDPARVTSVFKLGGGEYVGTWALAPEEAVVAAFAQLEEGDFNTWAYADVYRAKVSSSGRTVACGDYTAVRDAAR